MVDPGLIDERIVAVLKFLETRLIRATGIQLPSLS
jgi:hypothetical protein